MVYQMMAKYPTIYGKSGLYYERELIDWHYLACKGAKCWQLAKLAMPACLFAAVQSIF